MRTSRAGVGILLWLTLPLVSCSPLGPFSLDGPYDGQLYIDGGPDSRWMGVGESVQLTASVYRNSGGYTPVGATWSSTNENVAHVTQTGLATVVGTGRASIKAEYPGASPGFVGVEGIPSFAGMWTADLVVTACVPTSAVGFTQAWCDSTVGTVSTVRFDLTQHLGKVSGSWTRNGASAPLRTVSITMQGGSAHIPIGDAFDGYDGFSSEFNLTCADSAHLTGSFTHSWHTPDTNIFQLLGRTSGEVRNGLKQ